MRDEDLVKRLKSGESLCDEAANRIAGLGWLTKKLQGDLDATIEKLAKAETKADEERYMKEEETDRERLICYICAATFAAFALGLGYVLYYVV